MPYADTIKTTRREIRAKATKAAWPGFAAIMALTLFLGVGPAFVTLFLYPIALFEIVFVILLTSALVGEGQATLQMALSRRIYARQNGNRAARERAWAVVGGVLYTLAAIAESFVVFIFSRSASGTQANFATQPGYVWLLLLYAFVWAGMFAWGAFQGKWLAQVIEQDYLPLTEPSRN